MRSADGVQPRSRLPPAAQRATSRFPVATARSITAGLLLTERGGRIECTSDRAPPTVRLHALVDVLLGHAHMDSGHGSGSLIRNAGSIRKRKGLTFRPLSNQTHARPPPSPGQPSGRHQRQDHPRPAGSARGGIPPAAGSIAGSGCAPGIGKIASVGTSALEAACCTPDEVAIPVWLRCGEVADCGWSPA